MAVFKTGLESTRDDASKAGVTETLEMIKEKLRQEEDSEDDESDDEDEE